MTKSDGTDADYQDRSQKDTAVIDTVTHSSHDTGDVDAKDLANKNSGYDVTRIFDLTLLRALDALMTARVTLLLRHFHVRHEVCGRKKRSINDQKIFYRW